MNSKSFRNIPGSKHRSSSTAFISLHFNKADEDQLEINYGEKSPSREQKETKDDTFSETSSTSGTKLSDYDVHFVDDEEETASRSSVESISDSKSRSESRESTPGRDSVVKEYWSRISRRACSLDSDLGLGEKGQEPNEGWMFFKDIKGKLAKTLEERKGKEPLLKGLSKDDKWTVKEINDNENTLDATESECTPTDNAEERKKYLKLSPAIEASEIGNEHSFFESYINDELEKAKCEIVGIKKEDLAPNTQSLPQVKKSPKKTKDQKDTPKKEFSMTLSSLMSNRHPGPETTTEEIENTIDASTLCVDNIGVSGKNAEMQEKSIFFNILSQVKKCVSFIRSSWSSVTFRILIVIFACVISPFPSWISGFLIGSILSGFSVYWLFKPGRPKDPFFLPSYSQILSNIPITEVTDEPIIYKGWMNQLPYDINYNPDTYHVNCTRSLYVRLDGSYLRISFPQNNIPKRAMFNEPHHDKQFIHQQHYDITGASVELLPKGLARKRLWSKKYPICLRIPNPKQAVLSNVAKDITDDSVSAKSGNRKENPQKKFVPRINENNEVVMYLFARTDRDKDLWYNRFKMASKIKMLKSHSPSSSPNIAAMDSSSLESKRTISVDLASLQLCSNYDSADTDNKDESDEIDSFTDISMTKQQKFELYMSHLLAPMHVDHSLIFPSLTKDKKEISDSRLSKSNSLAQGSLMWLNVLIGRIFYDFLTEDIWAQVVTERIQRKLSKIKLPVFLNELTVKDINLGTALPKIHRASEPSVDQRGLWIDIDVSYNGSFQMTLETKLNLLRHKADADDLSLSDMDKDSETSEQPVRSPVYNSEEEDSAESSSDEDLPMPDVQDGNAEDSTSQAAGGSTGKKLLRFVDRLAQSTYFQQAAKNKYIKKAMEDISNTPLVLTVEVQWLTGTLALNIPPMPTDRLWYGFRTNPYLSIVARPKLGQHVVTFTHVTDWIERKLVSEFQKVLVMPNMDDLIIPIMQMDPDLPKA